MPPIPHMSPVSLGVSLLGTPVSATNPPTCPLCPLGCHCWGPPRTPALHAGAWPPIHAECDVTGGVTNGSGALAPPMVPLCKSGAAAAARPCERVSIHSSLPCSSALPPVLLSHEELLPAVVQRRVLFHRGAGRGGDAAPGGRWVSAVGPTRDRGSGGAGSSLGGDGGFRGSC